ncbi:MAG: hypothetical protein K0U78_08810, partial [Actinomycetia bacterium]|nr:hypothetical protein [Actinomycetes bacterium]
VWGSADWFHNRLHTQANNTFDLAQDVGTTDYVLDLSTLVRGGTGSIEYGFTANGGHNAATIDGSVLTVDANASGFALTFSISDAIDEYQWSLGIS